MHALWDYPAAACIFFFFTFPISFGPGFALGNGIHRLCGQASANREPLDLKKTIDARDV